MVLVRVGSGGVLHTTGDEDTSEDMEVDVDKELDEHEYAGVVVVVVVGMTHTGRAVFNPRGEASLRKSSEAKSSYM